MTADMLTEGTKTRSAQRDRPPDRGAGRDLESGAEPGGLVGHPQRHARQAAGRPWRSWPTSPATRPSRPRNWSASAAQALDGLRVAYPGARPGRRLRRRAGGLRRHPLRPRRRPARRPRSPKIKPADLAALHSAWFRPDNAILVLTGDITAEQGFALAEKAFGDWARPAGAAARRAGHRRPAPSRAAIAIDLPGTGQAAVDVAKPAIAAQRPATTIRASSPTPCWAAAIRRG